MIRSIIIVIASAVIAAIAGLLIVRNESADILLGAVVGASIFVTAILAQLLAYEISQRRHTEARVELLMRHARLQEGGVLPDPDELAELQSLIASLKRLEETPAPKRSPQDPDESSEQQEILHHAAEMQSVSRATPRISVTPIRPSISPAAEQPARHGARQMTWILRHALAENKVDLFMQPIVSLPSRQPAHYECFSRIRDEDQNILEPDEFLRLAETKGMAGTLDNMMLFRCVQLVRGLGYKHRGKRFFCNISAYSLEDDEFLQQFGDYMGNNRGLAERLVFELSLSDYRALGERQMDIFRSLTKHGFRLSIDEVSPSLVLNSAESAEFAEAGTMFFKLRADQLTDAGPSLRPALGALAARGIKVIASHVESEDQVLELVELELDLAQGYLFAEPRPARLPQQAFFARRA